MSEWSLILPAEMRRNSPTLTAWCDATMSLAQQVGAICFGELIRECRIPVRGAILVVSGLLADGLIQLGTDGLLRPAVAAGEKQSGLSCPLCLARSDRVGTEGKAFLATLAEIAAIRPAECLLLGQRFIDCLGVLDRVVELRRNNHLRGKRVVLLGDDDLVSIGIAMIERPTRLTVLDLDERLLGFIREVADRGQVPIETIRYDCVDRIPEDLATAFDLVICDPYPTSDASFEGLFWSRAKDLLDPKGDCTVYSFIAPSHKPPSFAQVALEWLHKSGGLLVQHIRSFNTYLLIEGELTAAEAGCIQNVSWTPQVSHTKDLVRFVWPNENGLIGNVFEGPIGIDYHSETTEQWISVILDHPLVKALGATQQVRIAAGATRCAPQWQEALHHFDQPMDESGKVCTDQLCASNIVVKLDGLIYEYCGLSELKRWQASPGDLAMLHKLVDCKRLKLSLEDLEFLHNLHRYGVKPSQLGPSRFAVLFSLARLFESYHREVVEESREPHVHA